MDSLFTDNQQPGEPIIEIRGLRTYLGGQWVHDGIDLDIFPGEILAIVGGSGTGKSTLLRNIIMLQRPTEGTINMLGREITSYGPTELRSLERNWGVTFQHSALFSSLTLLENVSFPLFEHTALSKKLIHELALLKIVMTGLDADAAIKYPAELSGGMQKRAALARALALDPQLLFLDEPTAGLDPQGASGLDELVLQLKENLGLTIVMVTHDLDTLWRVADRVAFLGEGKLLCLGTMSELVGSQQPIVKEYFSGPRAQAAQKKYNDKG